MGSPMQPSDQNTSKQRWGLGPSHWARVEGWGMTTHSLSHCFKPTTIDEIEEAFALARKTGKKIALRGGGNSYGDAATLQAGIVLDLSAMNQILAWDPATGIIDMEPGVTIQQLWKYVIGEGYWPPVVSGTMMTTMGGCAAMNIHGKNNYCRGTFGEQVIEFDFLLPDGQLMTCSPTQNEALYYGAISGAGLLGIFTRIRMKMHKVHSGHVRVEAFNTASVGGMIEAIEERHPRADYLVGWIDAIASGRALGRGIVHQANYLAPGEDPRPADSLTVDAQDLPDKIMGLVPKSVMHIMLKPLVNNFGMRMINWAKIVAGKMMPQGHTYLQSHAAFAFLLDYVPDWKLSYRPGGLIQYQSFIPKARAAETFEEILRTTQDEGLPSYLGVLKKHRPDPFLLTHAVDGYSLALDFRVTPKNRKRLWEMTRRLDELVLGAGGRFYFAKDLTLRPDRLPRAFPKENLAQFAALKRQYDPEGILESELSRRLFGEIFGQAENETAPNGDE